VNEERIRQRIKAKQRKRDNNIIIMLEQMRNKLKMSYLSSVSVFFVFLFLLDNTIVLADYENTFSSYFEQPCCSGPHHLRHHKGKARKGTVINIQIWAK
jgi:hypothetical protein